MYIVKYVQDNTDRTTNCKVTEYNTEKQEAADHSCPCD